MSKLKRIYTGWTKIIADKMRFTKSMVKNDDVAGKGSVSLGVFGFRFFSDTHCPNYRTFDLK